MFIREKKNCDMYDSRPSCSGPLFISRKELLDSLDETERTRNLSRMQPFKVASNHTDVRKITTDIRGAEKSRLSKPLGFEKTLAIFAFALCALLFVSTQYESVPTVPVDTVRNLNNPTERPVMYTFYAISSKSLRAQNKNKAKLLRAWSMSWSAAGWEPKVLTMEDAQKHPSFKNFQKAVTQIQEPPAEEGSEQYYFFMRWLAMAAQGNGGWMSSYDTVPLGITSEEGYNLPNYGTFTSHEQNSHSLLSGHASEWERVAQKMMEVVSARSTIDTFNDGQALTHMRDSGLMSMIQEVSVTSYPYRSMGIVDCELVEANQAAHLSYVDTQKAMEAGLIPPRSRSHLVLDLMRHIQEQCKVQSVDDHDEGTTTDVQSPPSTA